MVRRLIISIIISMAPFGATLSAQAKLDGQFFEYTSYYMSNFDVSTGESDVPFFRYRIYSDTYPVYTKIWFRASVLSPALDIDSRTTLTEIESSVFQMKADIILDNRNFSANTSNLIDEANPPNVVPTTIRTIESINPSEFEYLISAVMTTGQLADGEYRFELKIFSGTSSSNVVLTDQDSKTIIVESTTGVNLESPGGMLADTSFNMVYTTYPVFNWNKGNCRNCETYIRVAEFKVGYHSSLEEALRDERMVPFNQSENWLQLMDVSTYQYPTSDARPLEYGKTYVWQIKTGVPTTSGREEEVSDIYAFKIANPSESAMPSQESMAIQQLREALGEDQFNALFGGDGPLAGFMPTGDALLNNKSIDETTLQYIYNRLLKKEIKIKSVSVKN
ncbi:MAG: hypothetical protein QF418_00055 [Candidatus Marinimicrobia bacterium]|jgi:hypothetical protein|nr:hypothetical protein [Candidatus Neomarinimicrobiota bacterium]MDP6991881.1 hypothetical protein [Candidatus Neomarinimicrobiota bacterium]